MLLQKVGIMTGFDFTTEDGLEIGIGGTWEEFKMGAQPLVPRTSSEIIKGRVL